MKQIRWAAPVSSVSTWMVKKRCPVTSLVTGIGVVRVRVRVRVKD